MWRYFLICFFLISLCGPVAAGSGKLSFSDFPEFSSESVSHLTSANPEEVSEQTAFLKKYLFTAYSGSLFYAGAISLLIIITFLIYLLSREKIYLLYLLFLIFSLGVSLINIGEFDIDFYAIKSRSAFSRRSMEAITLLGLFAYCLFTLKLLDVRKQAPKLARWIMVLAGITSVYGILYFIFYPVLEAVALQLFFSSRLVILPMSLIAIIWVSYKVSSPLKSYFIVGSVFYFSGALLAVLRSSSYAIPFSYFYNISPALYFQTGIFLEIICFSLALSHRVYLIHQAQQRQEITIRKQAVHERDLAKAQVLVSRMQANPHLIFNSLNAIKYLIQSNQNKKAIQSLTIYSRFIRMILDIGTQSVISLSKELDFIRNYLLLESNRYNKNFKYSISISENVDADTILLPPFLLHPFIENAIWNSLAAEEKDENKLKIEVAKENQDILISIHQPDDGLAEMNSKFHQLKIHELSNERIKLFNKNHQQQIQYFVEDQTSRDGSVVGMKVSVIIKE